MNDSVVITIDGAHVCVPADVTVAVAMLNAGQHTFRTSILGDNRAPLCGMGVCHECRVTIDGVPHRRSCMVVVSNGMEVHTG